VETAVNVLWGFEGALFKVKYITGLKYDVDGALKSSCYFQQQSEVSQTLTLIFINVLLCQSISHNYIGLVESRNIHSKKSNS